MIDFNQDVILPPPPREVTHIGWERPVRISFDGAEGQGRVWVCDDTRDEMVAICGNDNCRTVGRLLLAWAGSSNPSKLPPVGFPAYLAEDCREVDVLCHAKFNDVDVAIVQDGPMPRVCLPSAFEGYQNESI